MFTAMHQTSACLPRWFGVEVIKGAGQLEISSISMSVLEIMGSIQTLSDHFGILSDPKKFGSDIWLSTNQTNVHFMRADRDVSIYVKVN